MTTTASRAIGIVYCCTFCGKRTMSADAVAGVDAAEIRYQPCDGCMPAAIAVGYVRPPAKCRRCKTRDASYGRFCCEICSYRIEKEAIQRAEDREFAVYGRRVLERARTTGYVHTYRTRAVRRRFVVIGKWLRRADVMAWLVERGVDPNGVIDAHYGRWRDENGDVVTNTGRYSWRSRVHVADNGALRVVDVEGIFPR